MTEFPSDVEVAIVAHNAVLSLPATIASVVAAGCPEDRITVIDVASTDTTAAWLTAAHPGVRLRRLARNDGPNPGRNVALVEATRPFVMVMDADVLVAPDAIQRLHAAMAADPSVKIGSPIVVHAVDRHIIQYGGGAVHYICEAINRWGGRSRADRGDQPADIGAAPVCAILFDRAAAIEVGLFDERYFMGKEDGDFMHRVRMAGHTIRELPDAIAIHHIHPRGTWLFYYQIRNRWHFILKNYEARTIVGLLPVLAIHESLQFTLLLLKGHGWTYVKAVGGLIALLPTLGRDRALARRIRVRGDRDLLVSGALVVRDDFAGGGLVRHGKALYEGLLTAYWNLLKRTVLAP